MSMNQEPRRSVAAVIDSYVALLALPPDQHERRKQLIVEVVQECAVEHGGRMYGVIRAFRLGREDAEDLIQEILIRWTQQLESGHNLPAPGALTAWFRKVARNAAIAYSRRLRGKRRKAEDIYGRRRLAVEEGAPLVELTAKELYEMIDRILTSRVAPEMQRVLKLWRQGLTYAEIADKVSGRNAEVVRNAIRKVRALLRAELKRAGLSNP